MNDRKRRQLINATKWITISELSPKLIQPLIILLLAQKILPQEFGIIGIYTLLISAFQLFIDAGIGQSILQIRDIDRRTLSQNAFGLAVIGSALFAIILAASSKWISTTLSNPELTNVCFAISLQAIVIGLTTTLSYNLKRDYEYKKLAICNLLPTLCQIAIAIPLANLGYKHWSIIISSLTAATSTLILCIYFSKNNYHQPKITHPTSNRILKYSTFIALSGITFWASQHIPKMALGANNAFSEIGTYTLANTIAYGAFRAAATPFISAAIFTTYCEIQSNNELIINVLKNNVKLLTSTLLPLSLAFFLFSDLAIDNFLPTQWQGTAPTVSTLSLVYCITFLFFPVSSLLNALGKPQLTFKIQSASLIAQVPLFFIWGTNALHISTIRLAIEVLTAPVYILAAKKALHTTPSQTLKTFASPLITWTPASIACIASALTTDNTPIRTIIFIASTTATISILFKKEISNLWKKEQF